MADNIENLDSLNETTPPAGETAEQRLSRLEETNKKLYERAKKAEADAKEAKAKALEAKPAISETVLPKPSDILKADEFKLYRQGYTESEIDLIMHNGGAKILDDVKNPLVLGLKAAKEQRLAEEAAGKTTDTSGLSHAGREYSEAELRMMKKEDLEKLLPHVNK